MYIFHTNLSRFLRIGRQVKVHFNKKWRNDILMENYRKLHNYLGKSVIQQFLYIIDRNTKNTFFNLLDVNIKQEFQMPEASGN